MASNGILVVSNIKQIGAILRAAEKYVHLLYLHLNVPSNQAPAPTWSRLISQLYLDSITHGQVNMNILVGPLKERSFKNLNLKPVEMILSDGHHLEVCEELRQSLKITKPTIMLQKQGDIATIEDIAEYQCLDAEQSNKVYDTVVVGGTFDRIHTGHKIFLTEAVLRACRRLVVGVATSQLTKSKILNELILPVEQRIKDLKEFLEEIDSTLRYEIVPIDDPFGPTKSDPDMDMIVVSAETLRGGEKVNEVRIKNNLRPLEIFCIDLIKDNCLDGPKELKISSSNRRIDMLGTRLRQPEARPQLPLKPYIIGLTGGIASGKSRMAHRLQCLGAAVMDCDKMAHEMYAPGQVCYEKIVRTFGEHILNAEGHIDRTKLGSIVFADAKLLDKLNGIVWPELLLEIKRRIQKLQVSGEDLPKVLVLEAALLLKAGWESEVHEVWSMIVPRDEAIRRVMERNGLTQREAEKRVENQICNHEIVARSHVVFSSQWESDFTQKQAEKAWNMLMKELEEK